MRPEYAFRFVAAAAGAVLGIGVTLGLAWLWGVGAYLAGLLLVMPLPMVLAAGPRWRLPEVLAAAAGTFFGPGIIVALAALLDAGRSEASFAMVPAALVATALYFTGLPTLIGLLVSIALAWRQPESPPRPT